MAGREVATEQAEKMEKQETVGEAIRLERREIPQIVAHIREQEDELEREERAL